MLLTDWILILLCIGTLVFLVLTCKKDVAKYTNRWRLMYFIPFIIAFVHGFFFGLDVCLIGLYLGVVVTAIGFFLTQVSIRKYTSFAAIVLCILCIPACYLYAGYRLPNFVKSFETGFADMKEHYSLTAHKDIDWDSLYSEYLPKFEEVQENHDEIGNIMVWNEFCNEFYDGHVAFSPYGDADEKLMQILEHISGNDYGLTLVCLDSGEHVAVLVEEGSSAYEAGIRTGTVITHWNGIPVDDLRPEARERLLQSTIVTNEENRYLYESLFIAGIGEEEVDVTFINEEGLETHTTLTSIGNCAERIQDAYELLNYKTPNPNVSICQLDEDTVLLNVNVMSYDSEVITAANYSSVQNALRDGLIAARDNGVTKLIIDLRNNGGGSSMMSQAIIALLVDANQHFWASDGRFNEETGNYEAIGDYTFTGENLWEGREIIILTNSGSNSATNHFAAFMQEMPNVTVYGLTEPMGAGQGYGICSMNSGMLSYSLTVVLDENGEIWVDSDETGELRIPVDERIPLTQEAVQAIFVDKTDYVLNYVMQ